MKSAILLTICSLLLITYKAESQRTIPAVPAEAEAFFQRYIAEINADHVTWIKRTAATANSQNLDEEEIRRMTTAYGRGFKIGQMEVEFLISMVMKLIANDIEKDLKQLMNTLNELKKEKEKTLQAIGETEKNKTNITRLRFDSLRLIAAQRITTGGVRIQPTGVRTNETVNRVNQDSLKRTNIAFTRVSAAEIMQVLDDLNIKISAVDEMSEMNSLRLQMLMDQRSKFISTLSNIMKKISETQNSVIQNLK